MKESKGKQSMKEKHLVRVTLGKFMHLGGMENETFFHAPGWHEQRNSFCVRLGGVRGKRNSVLCTGVA